MACRKPEQLAPPGKVLCRECGEPQPLHEAPNGICSGCYAFVEISRSVGIRHFQRLEQYEYDTVYGHYNALKHPKARLWHLDKGPLRIVDYAELLFGERLPYEDD